MGMRGAVAALLLLSICELEAYIDRTTYSPVRLDTFSGAMHSITGERFFGFKQDGFINFDMNCSGETGRLLLVALTHNEYTDVSDRPSSVCNEPKSASVTYDFANATGPTWVDGRLRYQVRDSFGQDGRRRFYSFALIECPPSAPVRSPPGKCAIKLVTLNPNGEHLSRDEIPLPDVFMVFILCWGALLLAYVLNAIWYWQYSNLMHKTMFFPAFLGLVLSILDQAYWRELSRDGVQTPPLADARDVFSIVETTIFFMVTMALSDGWGIIQSHMDPTTTASVIGMPLLFLGISTLTTFVHRYFLGLAIIMVVLIVVFVVRHSAGNLLFLHHRYHDIALIHRAEAHVTISLPEFARPIVNKLRILASIRSAFIFYCVTWAIVGIAGSFLDNHTWIVELMTEILLLLYYVLLYSCLRLRDFHDYFEADRLRQEAENSTDEIEVDLLADVDGKPFGLLVPLTPGLFRDFIKLQRRYSNARADGAAEPPVDEPDGRQARALAQVV
eukprot:m.79787 g.79787  ORF g.79787 m.79787 type:complete len:501 (+) comp14527_c0_seq2:237-1739(+)